MQKPISLPKTFFAKHGKRAVLLLHAYSGSPNDVRMLCRKLEQSDYTVYAPLFAGHGTMNPLDILSQDVSTWFEETKAAIAFLKAQDCQEIAVFGLSMGGIMAMSALTLRDSEIIGGGAFCSPIFKAKNQVAENFVLYAEKVLRSSELSSVEQLVYLDEVKQKGPQQLLAIEQFASETATKLDQIQLPVFLAQAGKDQMIDSQSVFATAKALAHTKVTLQWYPASGHVITVSQDRKEFEKDVVSFVNNLSWNPIVTTS